LLCSPIPPVCLYVCDADDGGLVQDPSANKESAVQKAGEMALKMYMGGGGGGGAGGLMSLASKFM